VRSAEARTRGVGNVECGVGRGEWGPGASFSVVSGQINPDWDCLQANHMSSSSKTDILICSFSTTDDI
jgi:hypothetical protein